MEGFDRVAEQRFDVVIIAGGISGASSAQHLSAAGYSGTDVINPFEPSRRIVRAHATSTPVAFWLNRSGVACATPRRWQRRGLE